MNSASTNQFLKFILYFKKTKRSTQRVMTGLNVQIWPIQAPRCLYVVHQGGGHAKTL